jgi:diguanylate cyclase (GGDEF)-like protein/PAS domain S-box-containing protein
LAASLASHVEEAASATDALAKLPRHFDIMVARMDLPGLGGLDLLRRARSLAPDLVALMCAELGRVEMTLKARRFGAQVVVDADALLPALQNAVRHSTERERARATYRAIVRGQGDALLQDGATPPVRFVSQRRQAILESLLDSMSDGVAFLDGRGTVLFANPGLAVAVHRRYEDLIGARFLDLIAPSHRGHAARLLRTTRARGRGVGELHIRTEAITIPFAARSSRLDGDDEVIVIALSDLSQLTQVQERNELLGRLIDGNAHVGMLVFDDRGVVLHGNPAANELFVNGVAGSSVQALWGSVPGSDGTEQVTSGARTLEIQTSHVQREGGGRFGLAMIRDLTPSKAQEQKLQELNTRLADLVRCDPLTGVLNRRGLSEVLDRELRIRQRSRGQLVAALIDYDDFKNVNEQFGHAVGDMALAETAKRLQRALRPRDSLARIGGDEFVVLLCDTGPAEALGVAERLRHEVHHLPIMMAPAALYISVSMGLAEVAPDVSSLEDVLVLTRAALAQSKRAGKNRVSAAFSGAGASASDDVEVLREGKGFRCDAQAIHAVQDGKVAAVELLARCGNGHLQSPSVFFTAARRANLLTTVDMHCFRRALQEVPKLQPDTIANINIYPSTLLEVSAERILALLEDKAQRVCIELNEQQILGNVDRLLPHVVALRDAGVRFAVDDVGFGYSCLESLVTLAPAYAKIDASCVTGAFRCAERRRRLGRFAAVCRALGAMLVAEGVEDAEDLAVVAEHGFELAQGYYWGKPQAL